MDLLNQKNLSNDGNWWIYHDSMISDDAKIYGNAKVDYKVSSGQIIE